MHEFCGECRLVILQNRFPSRCTDDYALTNSLRVGQELVETHDRNRQRVRARKCRIARDAPISGLVQALNQIAGLLKFNGEEVGGGDIDALDLYARHCRAA